MEALKKIFCGGIITAYAFLIGTGLYGMVWEAKQQKKEIKKAEVCHTEEINYPNDLHWPLTSIQVYIDTGGGCWLNPIEFETSKWDSKLKEGDIVDLVIRPAFAPFGLEGKLEGLSVQRSK